MHSVCRKPSACFFRLRYIPRLAAVAGCGCAHGGRRMYIWYVLYMYDNDSILIRRALSLGGMYEAEMVTL